MPPDTSIAKRQRLDENGTFAAIPIVILDDDDEEVVHMDPDEILARRLQAEENESVHKSPQGTTSLGLSDEAIARQLQAEEEQQYKMDEEYARQLDAAEKQAAVDVSCIDGDAEPATPGAQFKFDLQALGNMMSHWQKSFPCQRCTTHIHGDMAVDVAQVCIVTTAQTDTTFMVKHLCSTSHLRCPTCYAHHCTGCHELLETTDDTENMVSLDSEEATHCPELRAWQVFQSLVYLDAVYLERKKNEKEPQKTVQKAAGSGVGYGRESYQDYHSKGKKPPIVESASMEEIKTLSSQNDQMLGGIFSALIRTLPDADADNIPDVLPHKLMPSILRLSTLPTTMRDLCRNDSVDDCASRSVLYFQLLALFNRLVSHEVGLRFLCEEHVAVSKTAGIWNVATGKGEIVPCYEDSGPDAPVALVKSIYTTLEQLMAQAALFLKYVQSERAFQQNGNEEDKKEDEDPFTVSEAISLCGCITSAGDAIVKALDGYMEKNTSETHPTSADQMYSEACKKLSFGQADLGAKSNYANHAFGKMIKTAPHYPAKIMLQISTLSTSLPQGIFVRIDETRLDVAKALIIGPEDTPYAHGLFEFDIYLGSEYPIQAPSVKGKTTGGGRVRFNPNLYHCGKVCLSLLGTWPGAPEEQWQPNRSTLLQVLTSIQCMILGIDKPYFNEPGCGQPRDSPESQAYNKNVRLQNVKLAMCDWLEKGKGSLWEPVIRMHFKKRQEVILKDLAKWAVQDPRLLAYSQNTMSLCGGMSLHPYAGYPSRNSHLDTSYGQDLVALFKKLVEEW